MNAQSIDDRCIRFDTIRIPQIHLLPVSSAQQSAQDAFLAFQDQYFADLDPVGPLENLIANRILRAAYRLANITPAQADLLPSAAERADEDCLFRGLQTLHTLRTRRAPAGWVATRSTPSQTEQTPEHPLADDALSALPLDLDCEDDHAAPAHGSTTWQRDRFVPAPLPSDLPEAPQHQPAPRSAQESWRDRLQFNYDCSRTSPVVRNTNVTAGHVVSLVIDGWSWAEIRRSHPELTEDDIRACLAFTLEEEPDDFAIPPLPTPPRNSEPRRSDS